MKISAVAPLTALAATAGLLDGVAAQKVCSPQTGLCYTELTAPGLGGNVLYRFAIPDDAQVAPYDIAVQIVAPKHMSWAALSWGGTMVGHPLTVAWPNGNSVTVSSRMASGHSYPQVYSGATYTIQPDTAVNSSHWTLSAICHGCSQWTTGSKKSLSPRSSSISLAYAMNSKPNTVQQPSNPASTFDYHDVFNYFKADFNGSRDPKLNV